MEETTHVDEIPDLFSQGFRKSMEAQWAHWVGADAICPWQLFQDCKVPKLEIAWLVGLEYQQ